MKILGAESVFCNVLSCTIIALRSKTHPTLTPTAIIALRSKVHPDPTPFPLYPGSVTGICHDCCFTFVIDLVQYCVLNALCIHYSYEIIRC